MRRFRWITGMTGWAVGAVGTGLGVIAAGQEFFGLSLVSSLLILVVVSISGILLVLSAIGNDIDEDIDRLQNDVNDGFERVVDTIEESAKDEIRTDGSGIETPRRPSDVTNDDRGPTGGGALGGMVAGGAAGSAFGPGGVLLGGLVGGLLGNEFEYRTLKE